ncbi:MAG: glycosyltransferase [Chloroflexi bacterium]|nr:glycosyltransferase [Chloroflexota bacterium]
MQIKKTLKGAVRRTPWLILPITAYRGRRMDRYMERVDEYYDKLALGADLSYSEEDSRRRLEIRLRGRNITPKPLGKLHLFALFTDAGWEYDHWPLAFDPMGKVTYLDWRRHGFDERHPHWNPEARRMLGEFVVRRVEQVHRTQPLDAFFAHLSAEVIDPWVLETIGDMGIFTFGLGLDDLSPSFRGWAPLDKPPMGTAGLAKAFDLNVTSGRAACERYLCEGGIPFYQTQGGTPTISRPLDLPKDVDVSFIGNGFGTRWIFARDLQRAGVPLQAYGAGYPGGHISVERLVEVQNRSRINLGHAGIGDSEKRLCIKARDFEIPITGNFYLTRYTPELATWWEIGKEIECYHDHEDLVEKIGYYLCHEDEAAAMAQAARKRALAEYTWAKRFQNDLRFAGVLTDTTADAAQPQPVTQTMAA